VSHCICQNITAFQAHCNILILQHPHEQKKYYSTTKLVTKSLKNARLMRGIIFEEEEIRQSLRGQNTYLLYPGAESLDCKSVALDTNSTVIVVDGTWDEAGKIVYRNPFLKTFPRISFKESLESQYRIRKQPKQGYLSTIESIAHLLTQNAIANGQVAESKQYESLFEIFNRMVERQLGYFPRMRNKVTAEAVALDQIGMRVPSSSKLSI